MSKGEKNTWRTVLSLTLLGGFSKLLKIVGVNANGYASLASTLLKPLHLSTN